MLSFDHCIDTHRYNKRFVACIWRFCFYSWLVTARLSVLDMCLLAWVSPRGVHPVVNVPRWECARANTNGTWRSACLACWTMPVRQPAWVTNRLCLCSRGKSVPAACTATFSYTATERYACVLPATVPYLLQTPISPGVRTNSIGKMDLRINK